MKIIQLDRNESVFLIDDNRTYYRLQRIMLPNESYPSLVLSKLDNDNLDNRIHDCKIEK